VKGGSGGSRTLSISRSKREWSARCLPSRRRPESRNHDPGWESNPQAPGFKPGRSAGWRTWASRSGSRGTRTHKRPEAATCFQDRPLIRPDDFRESFPPEFRGLESNQRPPRSERGVTTTSNCPGFGKEDSNPHRLIQSQGAYPLADSRERHARVELAYPVWKTSAWTARPMTRSDAEAEGEGVEPSRLIARPVSSRVPSPFGLPFPIVELRRQESNPRPPG
jgi:hypothetical protein